MPEKTITKVYDLLLEVKSLISDDTSEFFDINEASAYLRLKKSYLYNLVYLNKIPFYKPNGKKLYFKKIELNHWINQSKVKTVNEVKEDEKKGGKVWWHLDK